LLSPSEFVHALLIPCPYSIFQIAKLGTKLKQDSLQLSYTPRKFTTHPGNTYFYIIESDHRVLGEVAAAKKLQELVSLLYSEIAYLILTWHVSQRSQKKAVDEEVLELPLEQFGRPKAPAGTWGSCIRIADPIEVGRLTFRCHIQVDMCSDVPEQDNPSRSPGQ
jgi:splicing factor 3B subunit 3